jgi:hypothetical protein
LESSHLEALSKNRFLVEMNAFKRIQGGYTGVDNLMSFWALALAMRLREGAPRVEFLWEVSVLGLPHDVDFPWFSLMFCKSLH